MTTKVRKGQWTGKLERVEFSRRFRNAFVDPAFRSRRRGHRQARGDRLGRLQRRPQGADHAQGRPRLRRSGLRPLGRVARDARAPRRRRRQRWADPTTTTRALVICGSPRNDGTCPGEISKTFRLAGLVERGAAAASRSRSTSSTSACSPPTTAATSIRARAACRPRCRSATGRAAAIRTTRSTRSTTGWPRSTSAGSRRTAVVIVTPTHWYQTAERAQADDRPAGLRRRRQSRSDLDRTARTRTRRRQIELAGWDYPKHLAGRVYGLVVHGDVAGIEGSRRALSDWLDWMGLIDAGDAGPARPLHRLLRAVRDQPRRARPRPGGAGGDAQRRPGRGPGHAGAAQRRASSAKRGTLAAAATEVTLLHCSKNRVTLRHCTRRSETPLNPILQKILAATGLTRRGELVEATAAIQRALSGGKRRAHLRDPRAEAPTSPAADEADVLDGLVREIDVIPAADVSRAADPGGSDAAVDADDLLVDVPPVADRPRTGRFSESTFTAEAGTRSFKLFEPAGFEGRALPLVVMLHGCTQNPDDFAAGTRMNALAQEQGLYVLYPAQAPRSNAHKCWNWFRAGDQRRGQGEPALLAGMTRHVMATHRDRRRSGLGRRPLGRRRDGGDPGARVPRPVRRRRRALRPAARRRARRGVGVLGDEVRRPRRAPASVEPPPARR